ncbi:MAG: hypothetical protein AAB459_01240 [Patescibacteria group bacterium]
MATDKDSLFELCLAHSSAERAIKSSMNKALERYELTLLEWLLICVVNTFGSNGLSMTAVSTALNINLAQTNVLAIRLVKRRLIRQRTQRHDRRTRHLIITAKGKFICERSKSQIKTIQRMINSEFTKDELNAYIQGLERMSHAVTSGQPARIAAEVIITPKLTAATEDN